MKLTCIGFYSIIILIVCVFTSEIARAQACQWIQTAGNNTDEFTKTVVSDASGNIYVTGWYQHDTLYFGTSYILNTNAGSTNFYLAKYDSVGNLIFVKSFGGADFDVVNGMTVDKSGNIYLTGSLQSDSVTFGATTFSNPTQSAIFLLKINSSGSVVWAKLATCTGISNAAEGTAVTTDTSGNIYLTGDFQDTLHFGTTVITHSITNLGTGVFVAKYDASGNVLWTNTSVGAGSDVPYGIIVDVSRNIYITGTWKSDSITFGGVTLTNAISGNNNLYFLVRYDTGGTAVWAQSAGDTNFAAGTSIATDAAGNIYVAGEYRAPTIKFGATILTNTDPTGSTADLFLVKYSATGAVTWAKNFGGAGADECSAIFSDASGNIDMGGYFNSPTIAFGATTLSSRGLFVAHFSAAGTPTWAIQAASLNNATVTSVYRDAFGNLYAAGDFNLPLSIDTFSIGYPIYMGGYYQYMFLAKFRFAPSGVPQLQPEQQRVALYPNPAATMLTIAQPNTINTIVITNIQGQIVYSHEYNNEKVQISVSNLPAGAYFVKINNSEVRKFVKM